MIRHLRRGYRVLALESSCDDSCVALLEKLPGNPPKVVDQYKKTLSLAKIGGIIPTAAHDHHHTHMGQLVQDFCQKHNLNARAPPDLICCTRGPGMTGLLSLSIQLAKGLSIAWEKPLIGVHHMLGHLLVAKLPAKEKSPEALSPEYPFLSLLCSGGHSMLVLLKSLTDHKIIVDTNDIAAGDSIDKCAREIGLYGNMLGKELEQYIDNIPQENKISNIDLQMSLPFKGPRDEKYPKTILFSFASFLSRVQLFKKKHPDISEIKRQKLAYTIQETIFSHIIDRVNVALVKHGNNLKKHQGADSQFIGVKNFICSGGVAANKRLRERLFLELHSKENLGTEFQFHFPDLDLCTDNAVMIGVAGIEIFETLKIRTDLSMTAIRKWPLDGLLEVDGWVGVSEEEYENVINSGAS